MKTSIATVCLSGGLSEKLQSIAAAGFRGVEIFESDLLSYNGTPADVAREMSDLGLRAITFQPFRDFEGMPEPQQQRTFERAERARRAAFPTRLTAACSSSASFVPTRGSTCCCAPWPRLRPASPSPWRASSGAAPRPPRS